MQSNKQFTLWFLLISAVATLFFGLVGWLNGPMPDKVPAGFANAFYLSLLAFTGDSHYLEAPNLWTAIARFTGLITTISALIGIGALFLGEQRKRLIARQRSNHLIMIGASNFMLDYATRQRQVTVFDNSAVLSTLSPASGRALFLTDRMTAQTATGASQGRKPHAVIFGSADGTTNVERARLWLSGVGPAEALKTQLVLRIEDNSIARDLDLLGKDFSKATLISRSETIARALVTGMAPTSLATLRGQSRVHVALVGLGSVNLAIAEELALRCHHPDLGPLRLTVVDRSIDSARARLRAERPDLLNPDFGVNGLEIEFVELNGLECCAADSAKDFLRNEQSQPLTAIVVAAGEDTRNVAIAMRLRRLQLQELCLKAPIFVRSDSLASIAPEPFNDLTGGLVFFGGRRLDTEDVKLERIYNELAEQIHRTWRDNLTEAEKTSANQWDNLPTVMRRSSYRAAMSSVEIFYAAGFVPTGGSSLAGLRLEASAAKLAIHDKALVDRLSRQEHTRWVTERRLEGFRATLEGEVRDDEKKRHPLLVPFEDLPKDQPIKDERNVKAAFSLGVARRERAPKLSCWRKVLRVGVIGPLDISTAPEKVAVDRLLDQLAEQDDLLDEKALEIVTPNAPGFDRLAAVSIAQAWKRRTKRACKILCLNAAGVAFMDTRADLSLGERSPGMPRFAAQTDRLLALQDRGHQVRTMDLRPLGRSDADLAQTPQLYETAIQNAQFEIMRLADHMIFGTLEQEAKWTAKAVADWRAKGNEPLGL